VPCNPAHPNLILEIAEHVGWEVGLLRIRAEKLKDAFAIRAAKPPVQDAILNVSQTRRHLEILRRGAVGRRIILQLDMNSPCTSPSR